MSHRKYRGLIPNMGFVLFDDDKIKATIEIDKDGNSKVNYKIIDPSWLKSIELDKILRDPNKGLFYSLKHIDEYAECLDGCINYAILKLIDKPLEDLCKLKNFYGFVGDGKHYAILTNEIHDCIKDICILYKELDYDKINEYMQQQLTAQMRNLGMFK